MAKINQKKVCVIGLGYVGIPAACEFASNGFLAVGIDISKERVAKINAGVYPLEGNEPDIRELLAKNVKEGRLSASTDFSECNDAAVITISVQTPFDENEKKPNYSYLKSAVESVGKNMPEGALVVVESTIAPLTMRDIVLPALEKSSGRKAGAGFLLAHAPERVTPGRLLKNLHVYNRVVGGMDEKSTKAAMEFYKKAVKFDPNERFDRKTGHGPQPIDFLPTDMLTAETVKTAENAYRDMEIAFANELALICSSLGIDFFETRQLVNSLPYRHVHLPGTGVGGHCLPKDSLLLAHGVRGKMDMEHSLVLTARKVNDYMPVWSADEIGKLLAKAGRKLAGSRIAIFGMSYMADSDDMRNSPSAEICRILEEKGAEVIAYDPFVKEHGKVKFAKSAGEALSGADVLALSTLHSQFAQMFVTKGFLADAKKKMRTPIIFDGRDGFGRKDCEAAGFIFGGVGK